MNFDPHLKINEGKMLSYLSISIFMVLSKSKVSFYDKIKPILCKEDKKLFCRC